MNQLRDIINQGILAQLREQAEYRSEMDPEVSRRQAQDLVLHEVMEKVNRLSPWQ